MGDQAEFLELVNSQVIIAGEKKFIAVHFVVGFLNQFVLEKSGDDSEGFSSVESREFLYELQRNPFVVLHSVFDCLENQDVFLGHKGEVV